MKRVLISVWDKEGLEPFARGIVELGYEIVASGKSAAQLTEWGIASTEVAEVTASPEMLGGRVKTLHPKIHGGILANRDLPEHLADLEVNGITAIDLVVCNLYPFSSDPSVELIDVGGPTMVRAAAKNHAHVAIVVDPADYVSVLKELSDGAISLDTRLRLARKAFAHTASYDAAIVEWLDGQSGQDAVLPETIHLTLERVDILRYGENPHQQGARYRRPGHPSFWDAVTQHSGKELSYLNLFDADAAWRLCHELLSDHGQPAVAIIKHANACGAAVDRDVARAFQAALDCDPTSAFGGIVAVSSPVDEAVAKVIAEGPQADVVIAPSYVGDALAILTERRKATRLLAAALPEASNRSIRNLGQAFLIQEADAFLSPKSAWTQMTERAPTEAEWADLTMAWRICGRTTSNAIAISKACRAVGVGAGQQSRVVAAEIAVAKAGEDARGAAAASDAFFPFPDGLEVLANAGVMAIVQPGGSIRDGEVVEVANRLGIAMVATGERHFRH